VEKFVAFPFPFQDYLDKLVASKSSMLPQKHTKNSAFRKATKVEGEKKGKKIHQWAEKVRVGVGPPTRRKSEKLVGVSMAILSRHSRAKSWHCVFRA